MKNKLEQKNDLAAIGALAIFYFVFLGGEYLFDNMIAHYLSSAKVVVAQSGILGISGIGFYAISKYRDLSVRKTVAER